MSAEHTQTGQASTKQSHAQNEQQQFEAALRAIELSPAQAQQLLGTLSQHHDDIHAAYLHQYRQCALEMTRADTRAQQQQLELRLAQLRCAQKVLLGEALGTTGLPAAENSESDSQSGSESKSTKVRSILKPGPGALSSYLLILFCCTLVLAVFSHYQHQHIEQQQQRLSDSYKMLDQSEQQLLFSREQLMLQRQQAQQQQELLQQHNAQQLSTTLQVTIPWTTNRFRVCCTNHDVFCNF